MKCISVPLNQEAMERLDYDYCVPGDLWEYVLTDVDEQALRETDIIYSLNASLHILIDDYEDECVIGSKNLECMAALIKQKMLSHPGNAFLTLLLSQTRRAITANTGVFFYF